MLPLLVSIFLSAGPERVQVSNCERTLGEAQTQRLLALELEQKLDADVPAKLRINCLRDRFAMLEWSHAAKPKQALARTLDLVKTESDSRPRVVALAAAELWNSGSSRVRAVRAAEDAPAAAPQSDPVSTPEARPQAELSGPVEVTHRVPDVTPKGGIGVHFGLGTMLPTVDLDFRPFYGFVSGSLLLPLLSNGSIGGFMVGAGGTWQLTNRTRWQIDLFGHVSPGWMPGYWSGPHTSAGLPFVAIGVGVGFHYTWDSGFSMAFKVPLLGFSLGSQARDTASSVGIYYVYAYMTAPVFSLGYRF